MKMIFKKVAVSIIAVALVLTTVYFAGKQEVTVVNAAQKNTKTTSTVTAPK